MSYLAQDTESYSERRRSLDDRGMTLIEILAVIVLLGLIISVVAKGVIGKSNAAQAQLNVVKMEKLKSSIGQYRLEFGRYPSSLQELRTPSSDVRASGKLFVPLAEEDDLRDVWGNEYVYRDENNNRSYSIMSYGSDGAPGGEGANQDVTVKP